MPCVVFCACKYFRDPELAMVRAVGIGGDTDTTASMVGAIVGALHGVEALPPRWVDRLENGARGRDFILRRAQQLLDVSDVARTVGARSSVKRRKQCSVT